VLYVDVDLLNAKLDDRLTVSLKSSYVADVFVHSSQHNGNTCDI